MLPPRDASNPSARATNFLRAAGLLHKLRISKGLARMPEHDRHLVYECGGGGGDLPRRELRARGGPVPLGGRAVGIFLLMGQSAREGCTKDQIMARVWAGAV